MNNGNKKIELIFWTTGILLILGIAVFLFYSIGFLVKNAKGVLGSEISEEPQTARFNLDGLEKLGLTEQNQ